MMATMISDSAQNSVDWAQVAIDAHKQAAGIEGNATIQVWHLLLSLLTWCEVNDIDFDGELGDARYHHADET